MVTNWYHHQSVRKLQLCFHVNAVCLSCKTWNVTKPGAWSARPPPGAQQSQDFSLILSLVLQKVLHSQRVVTPSHSRSGQCPGRLEARSEACSALSLKPKQHYSFNFPNIRPEVKLLDHVTIQYLIFLRRYHTLFHSGCIITSHCCQSRCFVDSFYTLSMYWGHW